MGHVTIIMDPFLSLTIDGLGWTEHDGVLMSTVMAGSMFSSTMGLWVENDVPFTKSL